MRFDTYLKWGWIATVVLSLLALIIWFAILLTVPLSGQAAFLSNPLVLVGIVVMLPGSLASLVVIVLSLLEILTSNKDGTTKALWVVAILLTGWIAAAIYYFVGRNDLTK